MSFQADRDGIDNSASISVRRCVHTRIDVNGNGNASKTVTHDKGPGPDNGRQYTVDQPIHEKRYSVAPPGIGRLEASPCPQIVSEQQPKIRPVISDLTTDFRLPCSPPAKAAGLCVVEHSHDHTSPAVAIRASQNRRPDRRVATMPTRHFP